MQDRTQATLVSVSRFDGIGMGGAPKRCTHRLLADHPDAGKVECRRQAEYHVKHPVIVGSYVCAAHLESEIDTLFTLEEHYEGRL